MEKKTEEKDLKGTLDVPSVTWWKAFATDLRKA
jgi:hypothetical protein